VILAKNLGSRVTENGLRLTSLALGEPRPLHGTSGHQEFVLRGFRAFGDIWGEKVMTMNRILDIPTMPQKRRSRRRVSSQPKPAPRWAVVVYNDNVHSFAFVAAAFCKVLRCSAAESQRLTSKIHREGCGVVWMGPKEVAELKRDQLLSAGPDFYVQPPVRKSLTIGLVPLDQGCGFHGKPIS
jgi:ATP-dependent Clp protease adapter protein ClpS